MLAIENKRLVHLQSFKLYKLICIIQCQTAHINLLFSDNQWRIHRKVDLTIILVGRQSFGENE